MFTHPIRIHELNITKLMNTTWNGKNIFGRYRLWKLPIVEALACPYLTGSAGCFTRLDDSIRNQCAPGNLRAGVASL